MISGFFDSNDNLYTAFWNKYRPSILKMMMAAEEGTQEYQFYSHELKGIKSTVKSFSFALQVDNGKTAYSTKTPIIARDLLKVLQFSRKASELMESQSFEFKLDRNYMLHVTRSKIITDNDPA